MPSPEQLLGFKVIISTVVTAGRLASLGIGSSVASSMVSASPEATSSPSLSAEPALTRSLPSSASATLGLGPDFFTHVLIDEAAQTTECNLSVAISLAGPRTKIVMFGDHMQMGATTECGTAARLRYPRSTLARLFPTRSYSDPSSPTSRCRCELRNNYRSHPQLIQLTMQLFYGYAVEAQALHVPLLRFPNPHLAQSATTFIAVRHRKMPAPEPDASLA